MKLKSISLKKEQSLNAKVYSLLFSPLFFISSFAPQSSFAANYDDFILMARQKVIVIDEVYDFGGKEVILPKNSVLSFGNNGGLTNGRIIGDCSTIEGARHSVGVRLLGTWNQSVIEDGIFDESILDDMEIMRNIEVLQSDSIINTVFLNKDYNLSVLKEGGACIRPTSNTTYIINSTISIVPNSYPSYSIILIQHKNNVSIKGDGCIVGDVGRHQYLAGTSSEWGFGIKIYESSHVTIEGLVITKSIGDGIYISGGNEVSIMRFDHASRDVVISNVICDDNRRQGISVIHVDGLKAINCTFCNTGKTEFTKPGSGIDIEPNTSNNRNMSVRDVTVSRCVAFGNAQYDYVTSGCVFEKGRYNFKNVVFTECKSEGVCYFTSPVVLSESEVNSVKLLGYDIPINVIIKSTLINNGFDFHCPKKKIILAKNKKLINRLTIENCKLAYYDSNKKGHLFRIMSGNMENVGDIIIKKTKIDITTESPSFQLSEKNAFSVRFIDSEINMPNVNLISKNEYFKSTKITCASVNGGERFSSKQFSDCVFFFKQIK